MLPARHALLGALLGFLLALPTTAAAQPLISNVQVSETGPLLIINGANFGTATPQVWLDFVQLTVVSSSPTQVVANLPPTAAGTCLVTLIQGVEVAFGEVMIGAIGRLTAPPPGVASPAGGFSSASLSMAASTRNSLTSAEERQTFRWQADPVANNTANPSGRLSLNFAAGTATPAPTGLSIGENGVVTFVPGQTFPGVVTGVTAGSGISSTGTAANPAVNIAAGGVTSAMIATSAVTSADILNGQVGTADLAFDPATQAELTAHEHDTRYLTESAAADQFHPIYTQLLYSDRHVGGAPGGDFNPFTFLEVGTFTKRRADSRILLLWNGSVRVDKNDVRFYNHDQCGYQLRIDNAAAANEAGQGWSYIEDQSIPMNLSATFEDLEAGEHTVSIWIAGSGGAITGPQACEINPASIPESVIVVESGR